MGCYVCDHPTIIETHHIWLQAAGGKAGPTVGLCSNCHAAIHKTAMSLISKKSNKKVYFTDDQMIKAKPLIQYAVMALQKIRDNPDMNQTVNLYLKPSRRLLTILHIMKTNAGYTNLNDFCLSILTSYAKSNL